jgi:apolipoprotein N-acyltransferase
LAFAPIFAAPILLLTFPALFWLALGPAGNTAAGTACAPPHGRWPRLKRAAICGWWFGFGFHFAGLYWIGSAFLVEAGRFALAMPFAVVLMPAGLALFHAAALAAASQLRGSDLERALAMALAIAAAEWLRGTIFTGFPWNTLGYALTYPLILMQSASVVGIYGLSLFAAIFATLPLVVIVNPGDIRDRRRNAVALVALVALPFAAALAYGAATLSRPDPPMREGIRLRLVQPDIAQAEKFRPEKHRAIFEQTLALSTQPATIDRATGQRSPITHIVWPEAAMPFFALRNREAMNKIAAALKPGQTLIAGTLRAEPKTITAETPNYRVFNSTVVLDANAGLVAAYDKVHLVPFGEYLPYQTTLEALGLMHLTRQRGGFTPGPSPRRLMQIPGLPPLSMMICYEAIFPAMARPSDQRPGLLVNLTNDAWFGTTSGPYQHFQQARVRAVEQGVPLIRVANNGVSGIVDGRGRILDMLGLNQRGIIDTRVPRPTSSPPYAHFGDRIFALVWLAIAAVLGLLTTVGQAQTRREIV